ncbi:MAG: hypothetical protein V1837_00385 [Candidatus Woesearchaeota archaeon]
MAKLEDLKKMSPEERIRVLKQMEEEKKKEIEEARKLISESENEIGREEEIKKEMPIPQARSVNIENLFTREEKQIFATKRFADKTETQEESLEETIKDVGLQKKIQEERQYVIAHLKRPTEEFISEVHNLYNEAKQEIQDKGYLAQETREHIMHAYVEAGERERMDKQQDYRVPGHLAEEFNASQKMAKSFLEWYQQ